MCCLLRLVICSLSPVGKMKFTVMLSRLLQLSLSHLDVFNSSGSSKHGRIPLFSNKPLVFSWCMWNTSGWQKFLLFPCHTLTLKWSLLKQAQDLPLFRKGPSLTAYYTGLWAPLTKPQCTQLRISRQTEYENFTFPFFLCFPSGILILSAWNSQSLWIYLDNSHAENLQEKGSDFLHKLLAQQLNGWLLPLQKIYSSKRQLFTKGTHKHIKQLGLKVVSSRKVKKC